MIKILSKYAKVFALVTAVTLSVYFFVRILYFLDYNYSPFDRIFASLLLIAEIHMILQAAGFIVHTVKLSKGSEQFKFANLNDNDLPNVTVICPIKDEPETVLRQTIITLKSLDYNAKEVYLLDGSRIKENIISNKALCDHYGIHHWIPTIPSESKAHIINQFLELVDTKYLAIFDADQNPMPDFLKEVVALAEYDPNIAFVQTPQLYSNLGNSPIAKGSAMQQSIFYESICEAKGSANAMFCCGTNFLMRSNVLKKVGGFDQSSITEDFATSIKIHQLGYRSIYYNHVRVFGMAPESLPAYFKQQARWAGGVVGLLRKIISEFFKNPKSLSLEQWWEYFQSSSYYFVGWAFFLLMLGPISYLIWDIPSYFMDANVYIATFIPYYVMTLTVFYTTMKRRNYGLSEVFNGIILSSISFPILMVAVLNGLFRKNLKFVVTPKGDKEIISFWGLLPWTIMLSLNAIAITAGIIDFNDNPYAKLVNIIWCLYHFIILAQVLRLNYAPQSEKVFKLIDPKING